MTTSPKFIIGLMESIEGMKTINTQGHNIIKQIFEKLSEIDNDEIRVHLEVLDKYNTDEHILSDGKKKIIKEYNAIKGILNGEEPKKPKPKQTKTKTEKTKTVEVKPNESDESDEEQSDDGHSEDGHSEDGQTDDEEEREVKKVVKNVRGLKKTLVKGKKIENVVDEFLKEYKENMEHNKKSTIKEIFKFDKTELRIGPANFEEMYSKGIFDDLCRNATKVKQSLYPIVTKTSEETIKIILDKCGIPYFDKPYVYEDGEVLTKRKTFKKTETKKKGSTIDLIVPDIDVGSNVKNYECSAVFYNMKNMTKFCKLYSKNIQIYYISVEEVPQEKRNERVTYITVEPKKVDFHNFIAEIKKQIDQK